MLWKIEQKLKMRKWPYPLTTNIKESLKNIETPKDSQTAIYRPSKHCNFYWKIDTILRDEILVTFSEKKTRLWETYYMDFFQIDLVQPFFQGTWNVWVKSSMRSFSLMKFTWISATVPNTFLLKKLVVKKVLHINKFQPWRIHKK